MTEEAKTTESENQGATETQETKTPETQATQPEPKSIFDGFSVEDKAYLDKKGWNEENYVSQSFKAYRNLEKLMGGSKELIEFPKDGDKDGYNAVLKRLGLPETKEGYSYEAGDDSQKENVEILKDIAIKSRMTKSQFNDFVEAFSAKDKEVHELNQKAFLDQKKQDLNDYATEHGKDFANIKDNADRALRMYGITEEDRLGLENGIGIKRFFDIFGTIGKNLQEGSLVTSANDSVTKTTETYQLELDKLFADPEFMSKYIQGDVNAKNKVMELNKKISGGK